METAKVMSSSSPTIRQLGKGYSGRCSSRHRTPLHRIALLHPMLHFLILSSHCAFQSLVLWIKGRRRLLCLPVVVFHFPTFSLMNAYCFSLSDEVGFVESLLKGLFRDVSLTDLVTGYVLLGHMYRPPYRYTGIPVELVWFRNRLNNFLNFLRVCTGTRSITCASAPPCMAGSSSQRGSDELSELQSVRVDVN